jgi:hypothetical protein
MVAAWLSAQYIANSGADHDASENGLRLIREKASPVISSEERVAEGTRTPDILDHNQVLYQLSYSHHGRRLI